MGKWTKAAKKLKEYWNERESKATDMEVLISGIAKLPPGQLKKVLTDEVMAVLEKYGYTEG